jgi:2-polyprenyl-3-methyl-5-hydroxy-6-metoxy-1,4-benzoquinol methylase
MPAATRACWCGNTALEPFDDDYARCSVCETLVRMVVPPDIDRVSGDEDAFYGRDYWFRHQTEDLGVYDVVERARRDLPERCAHWTKILLSRKATPGSSLDVGCGHGGFVAFLRSLGFDASGLELSPAVVEFARATFAIPVEIGRLEDQTGIPAASLDLIVLMDVIEHLPDPFATLRFAARLLRPDGIVFFQTPRYPEGTSRAELEERDDLFLRMLVPEHLYLYSQTSIRLLLARNGLEAVEFDAPLAAHDMLGFAAATVVPTATDAAIDALLESAPSARFVTAVLDAKALVAEELASLYGDHARLSHARDDVEAYAIDLRAALDRTEREAERYASALKAEIAARDAEIEVLKARGAE